MNAYVIVRKLKQCLKLLFLYFYVFIFTQNNNNNIYIYIYIFNIGYNIIIDTYEISECNIEIKKEPGYLLCIYY